MVNMIMVFGCQTAVITATAEAEAEAVVVVFMLLRFCVVPFQRITCVCLPLSVVGQT